MDIDLRKLRERVRMVVEDIRRVRVAVRATGRHDAEGNYVPWDTRAAAELAGARAEATILCGLRAMHRRRRHLTRFPCAGFQTEEDFVSHVEDVGRTAYPPQAEKEAVAA